MLRSVSIQNFIHFTQHQRLIFQEGPNFIIGGNSSGKTALFEMIRRCLSNKINTTTSSVPEKDKLAHAICVFEVPQGIEIEDNLVFESIQSKLVAGIFVKFKPATAKDFYFYKFVAACNSNETWKLFVQRFDGFHDCNIDDLSGATCGQLTEGEAVCNSCSSIADNATSNSQVQTVIENLFNLIEEMNFDQNNEKNDQIEKTFLWLTEMFVGIFPMRSIGPTQWTRSRLVNCKSRKQNYKSANDHAEILRDLLDKKKKQESNSHESTEKEYLNLDFLKTCHRHLVDPYRFVIMDESDEDNLHILVSNKDAEQSETLLPLLKAPEGIVEAMQLILLLSEKKTLTLTLEEPERGMHPQMINKMRDWVLKKVKSKTILVISHHPALLDHYSMGRVYICSNSDNDGNLSHNVQKFPKEYRKYGRVEEMKAMLFAERVLFVEGITDKILFEALFETLVNSDDMLEQIKNIWDDQTDEMRRYISSLQIVELGGKDNGKSKMDFCEKIGKQSLVVYDSDAMITKGDKVKIEPKKTGIDYTKEFDCMCQFSKDKIEVKRFEEKCEERNAFLWIDGGLETIINQISDHIEDETLKRSLGLPIKDNNHKGWKQNFPDKDENDIISLTKTLIRHSSNFKRFFNFLHVMLNKGNIDS